MKAQHHSYRRDLDSPEAGSLIQLARWIPPGATVLELGPASGYFTRYMAESLGCTIDALELDAAMAELARPWCRRLLVGNLETFRLKEAFGAGGYQVVVLADVLEHLREPETLLQQLPELLSPGGQILVSVPNVAYAGLVASLLAGEFAYREEGLLDRTHLRFFTRTSIEALLKEAGFHPWAWQAVYRPLWESEFGTRIETLPPALVETISANPHSLCYQWLIAAKTDPPPEQPEEPQACCTDTFPLRVFWSDSGQEFAYERSAVAWGEIGTLRQTVRIVLPISGVTGLRLGLADRPGYVNLFRIRLLTAEACATWTWDWQDGVRNLATSWDGLVLHDHEQCAVAVLHGTESWLQLAATEFSAVAVIEVELGWPLSVDYMAALTGWNRAIGSLEEKLEQATALVVERDDLLALRTRQMEERERLIAERDRLLELRTQQLEEQDRELAMRAQQVAERDRLLALRTQQLDEWDRLLAETRTLGWWIRRPWNWIQNNG